MATITELLTTVES